MDHDIWVWLSGLLGVALVAIRRGSIIHLHIVTTLLLELLLFLILAFTLFDILAASLRGSIVVCSWASIVVCSGHGGIFAFSRSGTLDLLFLLFLLLFDAVLVTIRIEIGLGLIRGELGWSLLLGIPVTVSAAVAWVTVGIHESYHLIAKRVTRGFSAKMFLRTFSIMGFAGGSSCKASSVYSLFT